MAIAVQTQLRVIARIAMQHGAKSDSFPPAEAANRVKVVLGINDLGGDMLRLTFLLCSGLFLVMLLGGRDFGQMRPGLARAEAEASNGVIAAKVPAVETVALEPKPAETPEVAAVATPEVAKPVFAEIIATPTLATPAAAPILAAAAPADAAPENTVFTLSAFADPAPDAAVTAAATSAAAEQAADGEIWYVAGNSLNVRSGPSTNDAVVGKLSRGEATLVVWREGEDWARIRIEGDGIEGYVAMRFLSASAPAVN